MTTLLSAAEPKNVGRWRTDRSERTHGTFLSAFDVLTSRGPHLPTGISDFWYEPTQ
jgi:hypothetical protein